MGVNVNRNFNRPAIANWTSGDVLLSHAAVDLKIDSSQQYLIYGLEVGNYLIDADQTAFLASNIFGYLDIEIDPTQSTLLFAGLAPPPIGELIFSYQITSISDLWVHLDFSNPFVMNGSRRLTFIAGRPQFTAGPTGPGTISLLVRGEPTQGQAEEKPRIGPWQER